MTDLAKIQPRLSGFIGGPGVNTFYVADAEPDIPAFHTFYNALADALPDDVAVTFPVVGNMYDSVNGDLLSTGWGHDAVAGVGGLSTGAYSSVSGACVHWHTPGVINGRRVHGRTFLVPLAQTCYNSTGQLDSGFVAAAEAAANALISTLAGNLVVWHQPVNGAGGVALAVIGATVSAKPAILRSRRD